MRRQKQNDVFGYTSRGTCVSRRRKNTSPSLSDNAKVESSVISVKTSHTNDGSVDFLVFQFDWGYKNGFSDITDYHHYSGVAFRAFNFFLH
jgi:hypothetical protein